MLNQSKMSIHFEASIATAFTTGILSAVFLILKGLIFFNGGFYFLIGAMFSIIIFFILGFIFSFILLFLLIPIFRKTSNLNSLIVFIIIGIIVPVYCQHIINIGYAHGINPYLEPQKWQTIMIMIILGLKGLAGSISAWYSLKTNIDNDT